MNGQKDIQTEAKQPQTQPQTQPQKVSLGSILIVDDMVNNLRFLTQLLNAEGYEVRGAVNGPIALKSLEVSLPDLILLDINMPGMDGYEVCQKLKENKRTREIPVIFLSALNDVEGKVKAFQVGGVDYITKPFQFEEVLARLETQLTNRKLQQQLQFSEAKAQQKSQELSRVLQKLIKAQAQLVQQEKMSSLGRLVGAVAHEVNNPVNFIYGNLVHLQEYTEHLLSLLGLYEGAFPEATPEIISEIEAIDLDFLKSDMTQLIDSMKLGSGRIKEIVRSLRNFARLDESEYKEVDLHEGLENTLFILQYRFEDLTQKGKNPIEIVRDYDTLPLVECYAAEINQVFLNILTNAIEALEKASQNKDWYQQPKVYLRTERLSENQVLIILEDNGLGMSEETCKQVFDPFFTTKKIGEGKGLGLAISHQIITKHGGKLECRSTPGEGAQFMITIPIKLPKKLDHIPQNQFTEKVATEKVAYDFSSNIG